MPKFIEAELFGMTIRESANDGSDFTNPSADYRRLFLGEDGQLHVKDSAGTVTDIGSSSGIAATIVDAKGDLIAATAADTVARLAVGTNGQKLVAASGQSTGLQWQGSAWTDYTPTWSGSVTNPTLGSTTIAGRYKLLDSNTGIVRIVIAITTGGAWNAGSGTYSFSLPASWTGHASAIQVGSCHVLDSGTAHYAGISKVDAGATVISGAVIADASGNRLLGSTVPVTWATGDQINITQTLEIQ